MGDIVTRDESGSTVRSRLEQIGVTDDLGRLAGWQRSLIYDALEVAHKRDLSDHDTLAGSRYLQDVADAYTRSRPNPTDRLVVDILERAATALVHL